MLSRFIHLFAAAILIIPLASNAQSDRQQLLYGACLMGADPRDRSAASRCLEQYGPEPQGRVEGALRDIHGSLYEAERQRSAVRECYNPFRNNEVRSFKGRCPAGWFPVE